VDRSLILKSIEYRYFSLASDGSKIFDMRIIYAFTWINWTIWERQQNNNDLFERAIIKYCVPRIAPSKRVSPFEGAEIKDGSFGGARLAAVIPGD
jgi:hypothetical protein